MRAGLETGKGVPSFFLWALAPAAVILERLGIGPDEIMTILKESAHGFGKCAVVVTHSGKTAEQADAVL